MAQNACDAGFGDGYYSTSCLPRNADESIQRSVCGYEGEWSVDDSQSTSCTLPDGSQGVRPYCVREAFLGNPLQCCLQNYYVSRETQDCFSSQDEDGNPANPNYLPPTCSTDIYGQGQRQLVSSSCNDALASWCTGGDTLTEFTSRWYTSDTRPSCSQIIRSKAYGQDPYRPVPPITEPAVITSDQIYSADGYYWANTVVRDAIVKYQSFGRNLGSQPGDESYDYWEEILFDQVCSVLPGVCDAGLKIACQDRTLNMTLNNNRVSRWCGCFLPDEQYNQYEQDYAVTSNCSPPCNREGVIPQGGINGTVNVCKQGVCILDDTTVNIVNSYVGQGISLNQVCRGCENGGCSCLVDNTVIDIRNSIVGGKVVPLNQACSSYSCTTNGQQTDCTGSPSQSPTYRNVLTADFSRQVISRRVLIFILLALGLGLIIFLILWFMGSKGRN